MPCSLCKKFKALGKVIAVRFRKDRRTQSNLATTSHGSDGSVTTGILPIPAVHPDSSLVQVVPARPESFFQDCASDMESKASPGKVIAVRISVFKPLPALPPDSSHPQVVSAGRESYHQVCTPGAPGISELSSQDVAGPVPLQAGPTIQDALDTLFTTIETIDIHHHYMGAIDGLNSRLSQLRRCLRITPAARNGPEQYRRDEVASEMQSTSDQLRRLDKRSIFVKQAITVCSKKLQQYLDDYKFSVIEEREIPLQQFGTSNAIHVPGAVTSGSLTLIDAIGHQREIPFEFGMSLQQLNKVLKSFFTGESKEARIQRHYLDQGRYDLCIDQGTRVMVLTSRGNEWPTMEPGMNIVMRVVSEKRLKVNLPIQCDSCGSSNVSMLFVHINDNSSGWTIDCRECKRRHQLSAWYTGGGASSSTDIIPNHEGSHLIRNTHTREIVEWSEEDRRRFREEMREHREQRDRRVRDVDEDRERDFFFREREDDRDREQQQVELEFEDRLFVRRTDFLVRHVVRAIRVVLIAASCRVPSKQCCKRQIIARSHHGHKDVLVNSIRIISI